MQAVQVAAAGGKLELVERDLPQPGRGQVRVRVQACGVCHSDAVTVEVYMPVEYPRVPGHEVAGVVDAVGEGVKVWQVGDRVGVGWFGGCFVCDPCRRGDFISCENGLVSGVS
jgi:D-arabinose 1-dehydrogenase-like Zn-dependent alcohol dehydrogenase